MRERSKYIYPNHRTKNTDKKKNNNPMMSQTQNGFVPFFALVSGDISPKFPQTPALKYQKRLPMLSYSANNSFRYVPSAFCDSAQEPPWKGSVTEKNGENSDGDA